MAGVAAVVELTGISALDAQAFFKRKELFWPISHRCHWPQRFGLAQVFASCRMFGISCSLHSLDEPASAVVSCCSITHSSLSQMSTSRRKLSSAKLVETMKSRYIESLMDARVFALE